MNKMGAYKDPRYRSALKAISWRVVATTTTILIVFMFTGKLLLSTGVGAVEVIVKLILYYLHERFWLYTRFNKRNWVKTEVSPQRQQFDGSAQLVEDP